MKPRDSTGAFAIYHGDSREEGLEALAFDSNDNLYAVMCGSLISGGPCNVVKFTPLEE